MPTLSLRASFPVSPVLGSGSGNADRVAEQFGVGRELRTRVVWEGQQVTAGPGRVLLFTGRSGSGKSTALRLLAEAAPEGSRVEWLHRQELRPGVALVDQFGDFASATRLLTRAGLGDSKLWILPPEGLSEGQRYRALLARMLFTLGGGNAGPGAGAGPGGLRIGLMDEFCATLDRTLAETVSRNLRRTADEAGVCLAAATTHEDVAAWLRPDEWWHRPDSETAERRRADAPREAEGPGYAVIEIPFRVAAEFINARHYKGRAVPGSVRHYGLFDAEDRERLIGAIMMSHPPPSLQAHLATGVNFYKTGLTAVQRIRETLLINRLVVDDAVRGRGLGRLLVSLRASRPRMCWGRIRSMTCAEHRPSRGGRNSRAAVAHDDEAVGFGLTSAAVLLGPFRLLRLLPRRAADGLELVELAAPVQATAPGSAAAGAKHLIGGLPCLGVSADANDGLSCGTGAGRSCQTRQPVRRSILTHRLRSSALVTRMFGPSHSTGRPCPACWARLPSRVNSVSRAE
jgi:energy-coupling factor transporter ATP-binding protein EcfA2/GNAT superfamily N-acetyltransferase